MAGSATPQTHVPKLRVSDGHILLSPDLRTGNGLGHLVRCIAVAVEAPEIYLVHIPDPPVADYRGYADLRAVAGLEDVAVETSSEPDSSYVAIVYDRRALDASELSDQCLTIGVDLGGEAREFVDYLVDILPAPPGATAPNRSLPHLLPAPRNRRSVPPQRVTRVLLAFGGEDPAHLTSRVYSALRRARLTANREITIVRGPANTDSFPADVPVLDRPSDLRDLLAGYDLIITSFGLTAIEGLRAGCAVVTVDPSLYHHRLSRSAGILTAGVGKPDTRTLARAMDAPAGATWDAAAGRSSWTSRLMQHKAGSLHDVLSVLSLGEETRSPVTGQGRNRVVARFKDRTYYRCRDTELLFLRRFDDFSMDYGHDYFFSDYQKQYGRTYLDDFDHIRSLAAPRVAQISRLAPRGALLDVGCAFGPFLDAARSSGYEPFGLDVSLEGVEYVEKQLNIPALAGGVLETPPEDYAARFHRTQFDVLTMWYVIEHFSELAKVLRRVNRLLCRGGVFAFSTPNAAGISGRKSLRRFLDQSPADHFTVWSPESAAAVLSRFGFRVETVRVTGHHPERFGNQIRRPSSLLGRLVGGLSRLLRLGDTFEVYAVKTGEVANG